MKGINIKIIAFYFFLLLLIGNHLQTFANQGKVDSIIHIISTANHDTIAINALFVWDEIVRSEDLDSSLIINHRVVSLIDSVLKHNHQLQYLNQYKKQLSRAYNRLAYTYRRKQNSDSALLYYKRCADVNALLRDKNGEAVAYHQMGNLHFNRGDMLNAFINFNKSLLIREDIQDKKGIAALLNNLASVFYIQGNVQNSLSYHEQALKLKEELGDSAGIASSLNNIGIIFKNQDDLDKALEYYYRSFNIYNALGNTQNLSSILSNISSAYLIKGDIDKAFIYQQKNLQIKQELGDKRGIAAALNILGEIYQRQGDIPNAIEQYKKSTELYKQVQDKRGLAISLTKLGIIYYESNQQANALQYAHRAYNEAKKVGYMLAISNAAKLLDGIYLEMGNYKLARKYYGEHITLRDSMNREENMSLTQNLYYKHEYEKRATADSIAFANAMEISKLKLMRSEEVKGMQRIALVAFSIAFILIIILAVIVMRSIKQRNEASKIITEKNTLLEQANEELKAQSDILTKQNNDLQTKNKEIVSQQKEIENQRNSLANLAWELRDTNDEVENQKLLLANKNIEITDSIVYAQRIQNAVLPSINILKPFFSDYFILHKPKSIVSGDFYWATQVKELLIFCVADCTGHGVPGALMSMLGIAYLNEIVRREEVTNSAMVINELRRYLLRSMTNQENEIMNYDGMDIGLCAYNTKTQLLQFSGANIPCWIIPNKTNQSLSIESIVELKPKRMPVGFYEVMDDFELTEYQLNDGDRIYICSDGYADQFGGMENKKLQPRRLKELIVETYSLPISEQHKYLDNFFEEWKGEEDQLDDVTILCIQI